VQEHKVSSLIYLTGSLVQCHAAWLGWRAGEGAAVGMGHLDPAVGKDQAMPRRATYHPQHASLANSAVVRTWRLALLALLTEAPLAAGALNLHYRGSGGLWIGIVIVVWYPCNTQCTAPHCNCPPPFRHQAQPTSTVAAFSGCEWSFAFTGRLSFCPTALCCRGILGKQQNHYQELQATQCFVRWRQRTSQGLPRPWHCSKQ
jgi:hypothetical protein